MRGTLQSTVVGLGLSAAVLSGSPGLAGERWQDPNACYLQAATFNVSTLQRLSFKDAESDYATTLDQITKTIADDPCVVLHSPGDPAAVAATSLAADRLDTPIDLLTYAQLGSNPYNAYVRAQYEPVRPSLYTCDVDERMLAHLDELRASVAQGQVTRVAAAQTAAVELWHDGCGIAHISPADILATANALVDPANAAMTSAALVAARFKR